MNVLAGFVVFFWIVVPGLYYSNVWYSAYLSIFSSTIFDNTVSAYNVTKVLTNETFDAAKYADYSPGFLPVNYALRYGLSFGELHFNFQRYGAGSLGTVVGVQTIEKSLILLV